MAYRSSMESVGVKLFGNIYRNRRVLLTGHTGFKGSWLALWLTELGAQVTGISLRELATPNHWQLLELQLPDRRCDVRDAQQCARLVNEVQPHVVFHLAAQSLVRRSYRDPLETWSTNVMGTANVLEACRHVSSVRAVVVVTSDKCYENIESERGYREADSLGGHDPYSASKAGAELVAASYRRAFFQLHGSPLVATARAGNVIGGGDWSEDRLIPDLARAVSSGVSLEVRSPDAIRPWQHVLDLLSGYLQLGRKLVEGHADFADAWNFGPEVEESVSVRGILDKMAQQWPQLKWHKSGQEHPHESKILALDSTMAQTRLSWRPVWSLDCALKMTAEWYRAYYHTNRVVSGLQLARYVADARAKNVVWVV